MYLLKLRKWVKGSRLRMLAGAVSLILSLSCGVLAVGCLFPMSYSVGQLAFGLATERVYEAPAEPSAALDGCLVKLRAEELSTECELTDSGTGVTRNALVLRRAVGNGQKEPARYGVAASPIQMGAYRLLNTPVSKIWPFYATAPQGAEKVKSVPGGQHVLALPGRVRGQTWYVVGRQQGDALYMEDPAAVFCSAEEWESSTRAFDFVTDPLSVLWGGVLSLLPVLLLCLWGTVAFWRSAWSCLADQKEYSRIPAWFTALFCAPAFALLGGAGMLVHQHLAGVTVYQYASHNTMILLAVSGLSLLVVWYRVRRWFKTRLMF